MANAENPAVQAEDIGGAIAPAPGGGGDFKRDVEQGKLKFQYWTYILVFNIHREIKLFGGHHSTFVRGINVEL